MNQDIIKKLGASFPFEEVEAKIQVASKEKPTGMAVFYIDSRVIQKRLDDVIGAYNWSNHFSTWQDKAQLCGISIYNEDRREWVTKHDGAENSDIESIKGGLTDAFKRAAVLWGIGRYLYQIDGVWVDIEKRGNSSVIKDNQQGKLKAAYESAVKRIFSAAVSQPSGGQATGQKPAPLQAAPQAASTLPAAPQAMLPQNADTAPQTAPNSTPDNVVPMHDYTIHSMKPSGKSSQLLELCSEYGELVSAFIRSGEKGIAVGARLKNVRLEEKNNSYGKYNVIAGYDVAA